MNPPHGKLNAAPLQRLAPGEHVLIDAVHQGSVQIEQKRRHAHRRVRVLSLRFLPDLPLDPFVTLASYDQASSLTYVAARATLGFFPLKGDQTYQDVTVCGACPMSLRQDLDRPIGLHRRNARPPRRHSTRPAIFMGLVADIAWLKRGGFRQSRMAS